MNTYYKYQKEYNNNDDGLLLQKTGLSVKPNFMRRYSLQLPRIYKMKKSKFDSLGISQHAAFPCHIQDWSILTILLKFIEFLRLQIPEWTKLDVMNNVVLWRKVILYFLFYSFENLISLMRKSGYSLGHFTHLNIQRLPILEHLSVYMLHNRMTQVFSF